MQRVAIVFSILVFTFFQIPLARAFTGFVCANYEADTVFRLSKTDKEVVVQWELKRGLKSIPLYEGIVNIDVLPFIQNQIKDLQELDTNLVKMSHPLEHCKFTEPKKASKTTPKALSLMPNALTKTPKTAEVGNPQTSTDNFEKQVNCDGKINFLQPKTDHIESYTLMTSWSEEKFSDWSYRAFKVRMGLDTPDQHYLITFVFDPAKCSFY